MIAVIDTFEFRVRLIEDTQENRLLLESAAKEVGYLTYPFTTKVEELLEATNMEPIGVVINSTSTYIFHSEW